MSENMHQGLFAGFIKPVFALLLAANIFFLTKLVNQLDYTVMNQNDSLQKIGIMNSSIDSVNESLKEIKTSIKDINLKSVETEKKLAVIEDRVKRQENVKE